MTKRIEVQLCGPFGPTFEVVGEWVPYVNATELQPEDGGCFDDPWIEYEGHDVTSSFEVPGLADRLIELATAMACEED